MIGGPDTPRSDTPRSDTPSCDTPRSGAVRSDRKSAERPGEAGQVTFFGVGMVIVLLFVGGISVDLWRVFSERRALAEMADAAAAAGANGVDVDRYRVSGVVVLDPALATDLAWESLAGQSDVRSVSERPVVAADEALVEVVVRGEVEMTLLSIFMTGEPFAVTVRAVAAPTPSG